MISLGQRISTYRIKRGLSQYDLGELVGMSTSTVGMWETDKRDPNSKMIVKLANIFGVTCDELLGNVVEPESCQSLNDQKKISSEIERLINELLVADSNKQNELIQFWNFIKMK